ncbi:unnamed protein product [Dovyalis caffra]|uniref:Uncharacterized protein n=1 Tax=Dovyalis caffra TaxID=77055 RepID=A0AAV1QTZ2_9ROSI|nr:unnamed protein product [Dovyalis caffra]
MVSEAEAAAGEWILVSGRAKAGTRSNRQCRSRRDSPSRSGQQSDERVRESHLAPSIRIDKGKAPMVDASPVELVDSLVGAGVRPVNARARRARGQPLANDRFMRLRIGEAKIGATDGALLDMVSAGLLDLL